MAHNNYEQLIKENEYLRNRINDVCGTLGNKVLTILIKLQSLERREERRLNNKSNANLRDIRKAIEEVRAIERAMQLQWEK